MQDQTSFLIRTAVARPRDVHGIRLQHEVRFVPGTHTRRTFFCAPPAPQARVQHQTLKRVVFDEQSNFLGTALVKKCPCCIAVVWVSDKVHQGRDKCAPQSEEVAGPEPPQEEGGLETVAEFPHAHKVPGERGEVRNTSADFADVAFRRTN